MRQTAQTTKEDKDMTTREDQLFAKSIMAEIAKEIDAGYYQEILIRKNSMKELTAKASLDRSVKFWFESCGYNKEQVRQKICGWFDIAYSPADERAAKAAKLAELKD